MTMNFSEAAQVSRSATIYTFPPRGRFSAPSQASAAPANTPLVSGVKIASGSGWYHDEAIQAEQRRKS
ncbi:MAG TPA: DUF2735 domain-containing protein [Xanthobacteraceae bacterium]|nr:DUF2735 domain-containing protein [Xanthobacteraceae bacterium]